jgi:hypothetical protein
MQCALMERNVSECNAYCAGRALLLAFDAMTTQCVESSEPAGGVLERLPSRFHLVRHRDLSGVSGTGVVAEGVVWSSGAVALHWPGRPRATSIWSSVDDLLAVHGHGGATKVQWIDPYGPLDN